MLVQVECHQSSSVLGVQMLSGRPRVQSHTASTLGKMESFEAIFNGCFDLLLFFIHFYVYVKGSMPLQVHSSS